MGEGFGKGERILFFYYSFCKVKRSYAVEIGRILLRKGVAFSLYSLHVEESGTGEFFSVVEYALKIFDMVSI